MTTHNRLLLFVAVAALVLAACAQPGTENPATSNGASQPEATDPSEPTTDPTDSIAPTPSAQEAPGTWTEAATFEEAGTRAGVHEVLRRGDGFVAIGERSTTEHLGAPGIPRLWLSPDGIAWNEVTPELGYEQVAVVGASVLEDASLLLVGFTGDTATGGPYRPRMWTSQDAEAWTEIEVPFPESSTPIGYSAGPVGHIAIVDGRIWFSESGTDWAEVYEAGAEGLGGAAAGDEGFVVARADPNGGKRTILASGDGVEWFESAPTDVWGPSPFGADWLGYAYTQDPSTIMLARSANGLDWETYQDVNDLTPPDGPKAGDGLASEIQQVTYASAGGLVVMTFSWNHCCAQLPQAVMVLTSPDADDWTEIDLGQDAFVAASAASDDRIVLGGYVNRGQAVAFWVRGR